MRASSRASAFRSCTGSAHSVSIGVPVVDGAGVLFNTHNGPQLLQLCAIFIGRVDIATFGTADPTSQTEEAFGLADVYDLWVKIIPTPGALALVGLGGIAALRRRRA